MCAYVANDNVSKAIEIDIVKVQAINLGGLCMDERPNTKITSYEYYGLQGLQGAAHTASPTVNFYLYGHLSNKTIE